MSEYVPIACIEHEKLEFAVLRRQKLTLEYVDDSGAIQAGVVLPTDVTTRGGAEWLSFRDQEGRDEVIRLDRILSAKPAL